MRDEFSGERWPERRRVYAFVEAAEGAKGSAYNRLSLALDVAEAEAVDFGGGDGLNPRTLLFARIMSTPRRLSELFNIPEPKEGTWLELEVGPGENRPIFWSLRLSDEPFGRIERASVLDMRTFARPDDGFIGGRGLLLPSRASAGFLSFVQQLQKDPSPSSRDHACAELEARIQSWGSDLHPRVLDVGQAQCVALHRSRDPSSPVVAFVDVGAPVFFHEHTYPSFSPFAGIHLDPDAIVLLSHWDWDHWSAARYRFPKIQSLSWYAPFQERGGITKSFRDGLGSRLKYIDGDIRTRAIDLVRGTGNTNDCNESGYVMRLNCPYGVALLTADVSYGNIPLRVRTGADGMTACHHMGQGSDDPPMANEGARVVASFGDGNKYGHAFQSSVDTHRTRDWTYVSTAGHFDDRRDRRGSQWLLPYAATLRLPFPLAAE